VENRVLVISSQPAFGKSIQVSLAESKDYLIDIVFSWEELEKIDVNKVIDLLIIDVDFSNLDWVRSIVETQNNLPFVKTIVFNSDTNSKSYISQQIKVDTFCDKPFYLPIFLKEINSLMTSNLRVNAPHQYSSRVLFTDNLKELRSSLEFVITKCDARQIIYYINDLAFASTGSLSEFVILDLGTFLKSRKSYPKHTDLVRYKSFIGEPTNFLVYLRSISESDTLVMIFDGNFPIQKAKAQVNFVFKFLQDPGNFNQIKNEEKTIMNNSNDENSEGFVPIQSNEDPRIQDQPFEQIEKDAIQIDETEMVTLNGLATNLIDEDENEISKTTPNEDRIMDLNPNVAMFPHDFMTDWIKAAENWEAESKDEQDNFGDTKQQSEFIEEKDNPDIGMTKSDLFEKFNDQEPLDDSNIKWADLNQLTGISFPWEENESNKSNTQAVDIETNDSSGMAQEIPGESSQEIINQAGSQKIIIENDSDAFSVDGDLLTKENLEGKKEFKAQNPGKNWFLPTEITPIPELEDQKNKEQIPIKVDQSEESNQGTIDLVEDELGKTQPHLVKDPAVSEQLSLHPLSPGLISLSYTFFFLPKLPNHFLSGSFAKKLGEWLPDLSLAFGWRLEKITIRPLYLSCTISASPNVAPGKIINRIRKETSKKILNTFPEFFENNPSKDFWAQGYLLINGNFTPSSRIIIDYIRQIRNYQGISMIRKT